jgi:hypothetical protein
MKGRGAQRPMTVIEMQEALARIAAGETRAQVARALGRHKKTIDRLARAGAAAVEARAARRVYVFASAAVLCDPRHFATPMRISEAGESPPASLRVAGGQLDGSALGDEVEPVAGAVKARALVQTDAK